MKKFLLIGLIVGLPFRSISQDTGEEERPARHTIGIAIGHAQTFEGRNEHNERKTLALPCWSLDYNYQFIPQWAIGLHTDLILEKFRIEGNGENESAERSYPVAPAVVGIYTTPRNWKFQLGTGIEFAKEENVFLIRVGVEYGVELPKEWEVFGSVCYDVKWDTYRTLTIGMGIAKSFGR